MYMYMYTYRVPFSFVSPPGSTFPCRDQRAGPGEARRRPQLQALLEVAGRVPSARGDARGRSSPPAAPLRGRWGWTAARHGAGM